MTTILVIEDERDILENIVEALTLNDYVTLSATRGDEALERARQKHPDLILCDIMLLGNLNGYDILNAIRSDPELALTPFVFITALSERKAIRQGMNMGADDYLVKPFSTKDLLAAVETRLERHKRIITESSLDLTQTKQALTRLIAHELRTPLNAINMAVQMLTFQADSVDATSINELVGALSSGTSRLNRLVEQMVLMVQIRNGHLTPDIIARGGQRTLLWPLVVSAINASRNFVYHRPHDLPVHFEPTHDQNELHVHCDSKLLRHALTEIIANAIAYSHADGQITLDLQRDPASPLVHLIVVDEGIGMSEDDIALAFEDFGQIDRERAEQQGMGLGLSLAKHIVEAHQGTLTLRSQPGVGTEARITLPLAD